MEPDNKPNTEQDMDPVEYLNSISTTPDPNMQGAQGASGTMQATPKNKKWPIILLIVLVVTLIIVWLVTVVMTKNAPNDENGDTSSVNTDAQSDEGVLITTLTCDKILSEAELDSYDSSPQSGRRNYFLVFNESGLENVAQYTELVFVDETTASGAEEIESNKYEDYYKNTLGLSEDPFNSIFQYLEGEKNLNIYFEMEKNEIDLDNSGRFILPKGDNIDVNNAKELYEKDGYTCVDLEY